MLANYAKRSLSFLLALTMIFSMVPVQAFATEESGHDHIDEGVVAPTEEAVAIVSEGGDDVHVHSYETAVTPPTCGAKGYTTYTCSGCGDTYTSDEVAATGAHAYASEVVAPTTEAEGYTRYTCSVCGHTYEDSFVEKLPAEPAPTESEPVEEPSALALDRTAKINAILDDFGIAADMSDQDVYMAIVAKNGDEIKATMDKMEAIENAEGLTEADLNYVAAHADLADR